MPETPQGSSEPRETPWWKPFVRLIPFLLRLIADELDDQERGRLNVQLLADREPGTRSPLS